MDGSQAGGENARTAKITHKQRTEFVCWLCFPLFCAVNHQRTFLPARRNEVTTTGTAVSHTHRKCVFWIVSTTVFDLIQHAVVCVCVCGIRTISWTMMKKSDGQFCLSSVRPSVILLSSPSILSLLSSFFRGRFSFDGFHSR